MWFTDENGNHINTENRKPGISSSQLHDKGSDVVAESIHNKDSDNRTHFDFGYETGERMINQVNDDLEREGYGGRTGEHANGAIFDKNHDKLNDSEINGEPIAGKVILEGEKQPRDFTLDIELKEKDESTGIDGKKHEHPLVLSISDGIWRYDHRDIVTGGQGQDTLREALDKGKLIPKKGITKEEFRKLLDIWDEYHLNDMRTGTKKQTEIIEKYIDDPKYEHLDKFYDRRKKILEDNNLFNDGGIEWGHWYYEVLPESVIEFVKEFKRKLDS